MSASQPVVDALVPLAAWIPDIVKPDPRRPPRLAEKVLHTVVALFLFLVCSQLPLWGVKRLQGADPFLYARQIMASSRGTLMELGIGPVVTAGMLMQLLRGSRLLLFDFSIPRDRAEHKGLTNLLALTITLGQALAYVLSGMYGSVFDLGALKALAIVAQLVCAGLVVVVLDEVLTDYGVASGISLFTCTNICESVVWKALSPHTVQRDTGTQFEGAAVAAVAGVLTERDPVRALKNAFYRAHAPNLQSLLATAVVVAAVVFLQGLRQELPVEERTKSAGVTGGSRQDPLKIRLFYTSTMPIILQSALVSNLYFLSQLLWSRFGASGGAAASVLAVFGRWEQSARGGFRPTGGLMYYLSPPAGPGEALRFPVHTLAYTAFMIASCAMFSYLWIEVSGQTPRDVYNQMRVRNTRLYRVRDDAAAQIKALSRPIVTAAQLGGCAVALLTISADLLGAVGSGTGILLAVNIIHDVFDKYDQEVRAGLTSARY